MKRWVLIQLMLYVFLSFVVWSTTGLFYLGYNGPAYTWTNKRFNTNPTYERLDRFLANAEWCATYPATLVYHLPMMKSDHAPILALLEYSRPKSKNHSVLKNGGCLKMISIKLRSKVGKNLDAELSTKKKNLISLLTLKYGENLNLKFLISFKPLKTASFNTKWNLYLLKTKAFKKSSPTNTT